MMSIEWYISRLRIIGDENGVFAADNLDEKITSDVTSDYVLGLRKYVVDIMNLNSPANKVLLELERDLQRSGL